jgi:hypothetical protein
LFHFSLHSEARARLNAGVALRALVAIYLNPEEAHLFQDPRIETERTDEVAMGPVDEKAQEQSENHIDGNRWECKLPVKEIEGVNIVKHHRFFEGQQTKEDVKKKEDEEAYSDSIGYTKRDLPRESELLSQRKFVKKFLKGSIGATPTADRFRSYDCPEGEKNKGCCPYSEISFQTHYALEYFYESGHGIEGLSEAEANSRCHPKENHYLEGGTHPVLDEKEYAYGEQGGPERALASSFFVIPSSPTGVFPVAVLGMSRASFNCPGVRPFLWASSFKVHCGSKRIGLPSSSSA